MVENTFESIPINFKINKKTTAIINELFFANRPIANNNNKNSVACENNDVAPFSKYSYILSYISNFINALYKKNKLKGLNCFYLHLYYKLFSQALLLSERKKLMVIAFM